MTDYFEFFGIKPAFLIDEAALKRQFYANSRQYHPDFYTLGSEEEQEKVLQLSTLNNEAYKTLSDFDKRLKYLLERKGIVKEEGQYNLPQAFLMELMEFNEALMELEFDYDETQKKKLETQLEQIEQDLYSAIEPILVQYDDERPDEAQLEQVLEYYLKKRYLLRIRENLNKFASA